MRFIGVLAISLLSACSFFPPNLITEDEIPVSVESTDKTASTLDWESYFVPDCAQIQAYADDLERETKFVAGVSYTAPSLTAWRLVHVIFEAESAEAANDLALGFAVARACIGVPAAVVTPIPVSSSFDTSLEGTAFSQVTDLVFLGTVEGVRAMIADGRYLIYVDAYGHDSTGYDLPKLYELVSRAIG